MPYLIFDASQHKEQEFIWFWGADLNCFQDIWKLSVRGGSGPPSGPMTYIHFDATCHNEQEKIWLRGANLKRFQDI